MYKIPLINYIDYNLMVVLEEINRCKLFYVSNLIKEYQNKIQNISTPEVGNEIYEYYNLYKKLMEYVGSTNMTFNQNKVDCWCNIDIKLGARQFRTISKK